MKIRKRKWYKNLVKRTERYIWRNGTTKDLLNFYIKHGDRDPFSSLPKKINDFKEIKYIGDK